MEVFGIARHVVDLVVPPLEIAGELSPGARVGARGAGERIAAGHADAAERRVHGAGPVLFAHGGGVGFDIRARNPLVEALVEADVAHVVRYVGGLEGVVGGVRGAPDVHHVRGVVRLVEGCERGDSRAHGVHLRTGGSGLSVDTAASEGGRDRVGEGPVRGAPPVDPGASADAGASAAEGASFASAAVASDAAAGISASMSTIDARARGSGGATSPGIDPRFRSARSRPRERESVSPASITSPNRTRFSFVWQK